MEESTCKCTALLPPTNTHGHRHGRSHAPRGDARTRTLARAQTHTLTHSHWQTGAKLVRAAGGG